MKEKKYTAAQEVIGKKALGEIREHAIRVAEERQEKEFFRFIASHREDLPVETMGLTLFSIIMNGLLSALPVERRKDMLRVLQEFEAAGRGKEHHLHDPALVKLAQRLASQEQPAENEDDTLR